MIRRAAVSCIRPLGNATVYSSQPLSRPAYSERIVLLLGSSASRLPRPLHFFGREIIQQNLNLPRPYPTDTLATTYLLGQLSLASLRGRLIEYQLRLD